MKTDPPTTRNIIQEVRTDGYFERARQRAQSRKNPWNLVIVFLMFAGMPSITYALFHVMWWLHVAIYPAHVNRLGEFWGQGISLASFISSFLLSIPLFFASIPTSIMLANTAVWLIPSARRALDKEAKGVKWASFAESMSGLWNISRIMVPICLLLSFIGAVTLTNLK